VDDHIGCFGKANDDVFALRRRHVYRNALLAPVQRQERSGFRTDLGRHPGTRVVTASWAFHLDDLCSEISENLGTKRAGHILGQIQNANAFKYA